MVALLNIDEQAMAVREIAAVTPVPSLLFALYDERPLHDMILKQIAKET
jgi:hypothetical protein